MTEFKYRRKKLIVLSVLFLSSLLMAMVFAYANTLELRSPVSSQAIDDYLRPKDSPLCGQGSNFVKWGRYFNIDPRLLVAISGAESTFGEALPPGCPYNAWGWKNEGHFWDGFAPGWDSDTNREEFSNAPGFVSGQGIYMGTGWEDGIFWVTRTLRKDYLDRGLDTVDKIQPVYCTSGGEDWLLNVKQFIQDLGGDPNDLDYPGDEPPPPLVGRRSDGIYDNKIINEYNANGGQHYVGDPFDNGGSGYVHRWGPNDSGWVQDFHNAPGGYGDCFIAYEDSPGYTDLMAHLVRSGIRQKYIDMGGPWGVLGWVTWREESAATSPYGTNGYFNRFRNGEIYRHGSGSHDGECYEVHGEIRNKYESIGGTGSVLGFPTSDEGVAAPSPQGTTGHYSRFEGPSASIYKSEPYGAHAIYGDIGDKYESIGGTGCDLGFPTSDIYDWSGTTRADFEGGYIYLDSNGNAVVIIGSDPVDPDDGDIDGDGGCDDSDANLCLQMALGQAIFYPNNPTPHQPNAQELSVADFNHNGIADAGDAVLILRNVRAR